MGTTSRTGSRLALALAIVLLVSAAEPARAEQDAWNPADLPDQVFDVLIVRPVGLAALVAGSGFFVISAPLTAPFVGFDDTWELFVKEPYRYAIRRSLGDLEDL